MAAITVELTDQQAEALAQMCKRLCWDDARRIAGDEDETRAIISGVNVLRSALAHEGYAPR